MASFCGVAALDWIVVHRVLSVEIRECILRLGAVLEIYSGLLARLVCFFGLWTPRVSLLGYVSQWAGHE